jgi:hypothetical protein
MQLADAQHVVAHEYGFASWPRLKAHVESIRGRWRDVGARIYGNPSRTR